MGFRSLLAALAILGIPNVGLAAGPPVAPSAVADPAPGAPAAPASPAPAPRSWHVDLGLGTQFPVSAGAMVTAELPYRILAQVDLGWMPSPYAYAIDGFLNAIGSYDDTVSTLIRAALANSFVMRAAAGWRPFEKHGFEATAGYTLVTLGGSLSAREVISALLAANGSTSTVPDDAGREIPLRATLHGFQIQLGWRWLLLGDRLVIRTGVSYYQCVASSFSVDLARSRRGQPLEAAINREITDYLGPYLTTYGKAPIVAIGAAYRF